MCRNKILVIECFLIFFTLKTYSQKPLYEMGLSVGYTKNSLTTDDGNRSFTRNYSLNGLQISIPMQYSLYDWVGIQTEISYVQKNYEIRRNSFFEGVYSEITNSFLQIPLIAHFSFGGKDLRGFLNMGGYMGYWMDSRIRGSMYNPFFQAEDRREDGQSFRLSEQFGLARYNERVVFDSRRDRRVELGFLAGTGLEYRINFRYKIFAEVRYQYGLTDLQKNYMINQIPRYNNTFGVQFGALYGFGLY